MGGLTCTIGQMMSASCRSPQVTCFRSLDGHSSPCSLTYKRPVETPPATPPAAPTGNATPTDTPTDVDDDADERECNLAEFARC